MTTRYNARLKQHHKYWVVGGDNVGAFFYLPHAILFLRRAQTATLYGDKFWTELRSLQLTSQATATTALRKIEGTADTSKAYQTMGLCAAIS